MESEAQRVYKLLTIPTAQAAPSCLAPPRQSSPFLPVALPACLVSAVGGIWRVTFQSQFPSGPEKLGSLPLPSAVLTRASLAQWIPDPWIPHVWTWPASSFLRDIFLSIPVPCCLSSRSSDCRFLFDSFLYCCLCQPQLQAQLILSEHSIHRKMHET